MSGLAYLAKHHIREGLPLTVQLIEPDRWGSARRIDPCLKALLNYGEEAKSELPSLRELEAILVEKSKGKNPHSSLKLVRNTIEKIESSTKKVELKDLPD
jgi:hypothetical protein